jgi:hypothetical protein
MTSGKERMLGQLVGLNRAAKQYKCTAKEDGSRSHYNLAVLQHPSERRSATMLSMFMAWNHSSGAAKRATSRDHHPSAASCSWRGGQPSDVVSGLIARARQNGNWHNLVNT